MARPYSNDFRERVAAVTAAGRSCREVAALFDVSVASVVKWSQRQRATGSAAAKLMGGHRKRLLEAHRVLVIERLKAVPDLNPIEQVFAKLKLLLRKPAEQTVKATWQRIGKLLDAFSPNQCAKYLRNSGYASI